jgi:hypothetical protein
VRQALILALAMLALGSAGAAAADLGPVGGAVEKVAPAPSAGVVGGLTPVSYVQHDTCGIIVSIYAGGIPACTEVKSLSGVVGFGKRILRRCAVGGGAAGIADAAYRWAQTRRFTLKDVKRLAKRSKKPGAIGCALGILDPYIKKASG